MGLWAAVKADRLGIDTLIVDGGRAAGGASGGLLGALMPHMPDRWSEKKQFQFDALLSLEAEIRAVEAETGLDAGYLRCGRQIPLPKPHLREIALGHQRDAAVHWTGEGRKFAWDVVDVPAEPGWPQADDGNAGFVHDSFAARVSPRALTSALLRVVEQSRHVRLVEEVDVAALDPAAGRAALSNGDVVAFGHCIIAAGHRSFPLIAAIGSALERPLGQPVKGQAALLRANVDPRLPLVFLDGLYLVPHGDGTVAVGSTSENRFASAGDTDGQLEDLIARARRLAPRLAQAEVVERWAGLRPKAIERDPMVGPHPEHENVLSLTGGFKVSFGLAHRLADGVLAFITGGASDLPGSFTLAHHLAAASRKS